MAFPSDSPFSGGVYKLAVGIVEFPIKFFPICFFITKFRFPFCSPRSLFFAGGSEVVPTNVEGDCDVVREAKSRDGPPVANEGLTHMD